jgi:hypothetical protein
MNAAFDNLQHLEVPLCSAPEGRERLLAIRCDPYIIDGSDGGAPHTPSLALLPLQVMQYISGHDESTTWGDAVDLANRRAVDGELCSTTLSWHDVRSRPLAFFEVKKTGKSMRKSVVRLVQGKYGIGLREVRPSRRWVDIPSGQCSSSSGASILIPVGSSRPSRRMGTRLDTFLASTSADGDVRLFIFARGHRRLEPFPVSSILPRSETEIHL